MELLAPVDKLLQRGCWQEALDETARLLAKYPANPRLNAYMGLCYFRLGRYDEALPPLQRATALDPTDVDAGIKLAQTYDRLKRYHECAVVAAEFLKRRPYDHTLQGLLEAHERDLCLDRDGWEKSQWMPAKLQKMSNR